ncbi:RNA-directed DNA polymerase-like protein [Cucumis melo var. makuwa]|uniref:RNA-directed DNA polymerase-like protein n=1 Tax=Cucumis melo var. makuwa TaxID=1194695 RepID=A0A5D3D1I2_CUCMM|nr:RNA-directed DNA polymerase-like protein [Cucumis melo var. makuwa]TYK18053.1 RNA-directed DNA polymerase-like protein [Cucumis melo var. makuwa]
MTVVVKPRASARAKWPSVQILVVVANIQMRTLKAEKGKGKGSQQNGFVTSRKELALRVGHRVPSSEPVDCRWTARATFTAKESCHHVLADDAGRIKMGCKILPRVKRDEFLGLKQGSLSVVEYERKYTELSRYVDVIVASKMKTALRMEQSIAEEKSTVELSRGASTTSSFRGREQWRFTHGKSSGSVSCWYWCVLPVWTIKAFQERLSTVESSGSNGSESWVPGKPLSNGLAIYTQVSDVLLVNEMLRSCEVLVKGFSMLVYLLPQELQMLDVILGMDFLCTHYASIDCHKKEVICRKPSFAEVVFRGGKKTIPMSLISVLKAEKLQRKGCTALLAHVVKLQREKLKPENVHVVKEFFDVFTNNLPVYSVNKEAHKEHLRIVLQIVCDKQLYAKFTKLEVVVNWGKQTNATEVCSFLGLAGYYRHFVEDFSRLALLLRALTRKNTKFDWKDYVIYFDASRQGLGCVLMQDGKGLFMIELRVHEDRLRRIEDDHRVCCIEEDDRLRCVALKMIIVYATLKMMIICAALLKMMIAYAA